MRNAVLILTLVLCTCALGASAQALPDLGGGLDKATFLASLGTPAPVAASTQSGRLPTKSTCTVNLTCDVGGYPLSCTSTNGDCHAGPTWVECDGNRQNCPVCYRNVSCACPDGQVYECWGWSSCSFRATKNVTCDGVTYGDCLPLYDCGP